MINVKVTGSAGTIILDRPASCNALDRRMISQLSEAFDDLRQSKKVRGIVLAGSGQHFCAGRDLKELQQSSLDENAFGQWFQDADALRELIEQMLQLPKPIIAAVDGAAVASGLALVLASDLVVASRRSTFSSPASRVGLVSGLVVPLLQFRIGASLASRLAVGIESITAAEGKELGMVHHVVDEAQVWVQATNWIEQIASGASEAIQLNKKLLNEMIGEQLATMLASGAAATATSMTTEAAAEGIKAFCEKREPQFP